MYTKIWYIYMHICIQYDVSLVFTLQNILIKINYVTRKAIFVFFFAKFMITRFQAHFWGNLRLEALPQVMTTWVTVSCKDILARLYYSCKALYILEHKSWKLWFWGESSYRLAPLYSRFTKCFKLKNGWKYLKKY